MRSTSVENNKCVRACVCVRVHTCGCVYAYTYMCLHARARKFVCACACRASFACVYADLDPLTETAGSVSTLACLLHGLTEESI